MQDAAVVSEATARHHALALLRRRGTNREAYAGVIEASCGPGQMGYDIAGGRITVPSKYSRMTPHTFVIDELLGEIRAGQGDLFGFH